VADTSVVAGRVDVGVYASHDVLVGVAATPEQREKFVEDTRSVDGVLAVRSYIQLKT
jgi:osmotically-inducible protein OsmY